MTGKDKHGDHVRDAAAAVRGFKSAMPTPIKANVICEDLDVLFLIGAGLLRSGWTDQIDVLSAQCLFIRGS